MFIDYYFIGPIFVLDSLVYHQENLEIKLLEWLEYILSSTVDH